MVQLVIESKSKPLMNGEGGRLSILKSLQNIANVKISSFSEELEQIVFSGEDESVDAAIKAFLGMILNTISICLSYLLKLNLEIARMSNFVVLIDYAQMHSFLREDNKAMQGVVGNYEGEGWGQKAKMEELVEKNEDKSRIIENFSTQKAEIENKIQQNEKFVELHRQKKKRKNMRHKINKLQKISEKEKSELKLARPNQEKERFDSGTTVKNESEMEKLKLELIRSKAEKDELERILSEKEKVIISQSQKLERKNQNLKDLLNEIHKSCTNS